jgi:hypothetical protein
MASTCVEGTISMPRPSRMERGQRLVHQMGERVQQFSLQETNPKSSFNSWTSFFVIFLFLVVVVNRS